MTPEEVARLAQIFKQIEIEKDPSTFESLLRDLSSLLASKERRLRSRHVPLVSDDDGRGYKRMTATVNRVISPAHPRLPEKIEISIYEADALYREIRVENSFFDGDGNVFAIQAGAELGITLEAPREKLTMKSSS
jgi:hypothetical protein